MIRSILGTAALLVGWSVLWFFYVVFRNPGHPSIACLEGRAFCPQDDGTGDILIWVIGLVVVVGLRTGAAAWAAKMISRLAPLDIGILVVFGMAGALLALTLVTTAKSGQPPITVLRSPPVGTFTTAWKVSIDPSTGVISWKGTDLGPDGRVQRSFYVSPAVMPVPWPAGVRLSVAVPTGAALGLLVGGVALLLFRPSNKRQVIAPA